MIALVQRVTEAAVTVSDPPYHAAIGPGLCVLLGVQVGDTEADAAWVAGKLARLRIFADEAGRMNRSVQDVGGSVLLVSQFTLAGDCAKGNRPSFVGAADPELGERLYEQVGRHLEQDHGLPVGWGQFGAAMQVALVNDGPVTLIVHREPSGNPAD